MNDPYCINNLIDDRFSAGVEFRFGLQSIDVTAGRWQAEGALAEAYALSRAPRLREPAQKAIDFIQMAQNPYLAWRYGVRPQDNDTSVTAWMENSMSSFGSPITRLMAR